MGIISHGSLFCSTEITSVMSTRVNEWINNKSNANPAPEKSLPYSMLRTIIGPAGWPVYSANRKQYHVMYVKELNNRLHNIFEFDWVYLSVSNKLAELAGWIYGVQMLNWWKSVAACHELLLLLRRAKSLKSFLPPTLVFSTRQLSKQLFSIPRNYSSATILKKTRSNVQFSFIRHTKIQSGI